MNILPKKKWHVRTKENVARVRRDQKRAAEEADRVAERAKLAEQEYKVNLLRKNAEKSFVDLYGVSRNESSNNGEALPIISASGHVNFFTDLEEDGRKNYGTGNKEYEEEKRKEKEEYESKVGILKYLGEGSNEFTKQKSWYEMVPEKRSSEVEKTIKKAKNSICGIISVKTLQEKLAAKEKNERKRKKHKHKKKEHDKKMKKTRKKKHANDSRDHSEAEVKKGSDDVIERLRKERLARENAERERVAMLLLSDEQKKQNAKQELVPKYSSQFNPELAKQNRR